MACSGCNYFLFWAIFAPLLPNRLKNKNFKEMRKKHLEISFYTSVPKIIICDTVPEIWCMTDIIIFHFGLFFALLPSNSPKNQTFKKVKKTLDISFYTCAPKLR